MKVIFVFIDGVGIGKMDKESNPLYGTKSLVLAKLVESARFHADASLGVKGLPQSATGQTSIFTGVNAALALNRHMSGQPTITLRKIIYKINMFGELKKMGLKVASSNVYRDEYLANMQSLKDRRNRPSVTSVMCMAEDMNFRNVGDFITNNGVYHDITGEILKESDYPIEPISPQKAAQNLFELSRKYDFTLFEHFVTDIAGHKYELPQAVSVVERLDCFIAELISLINFEEDILFITSDHGNLEDISVRTHTKNQVPAIIMGKKADEMTLQIHSLVDIMPYILELFRRQNQ